MAKIPAEITLNKWHFKLGIIATYWDAFGYMFHFGIFKFTSMPENGKALTKENYKGFWWRKVVRIEGFEISYQWSFPQAKDDAKES